jgi:hypothetical protein
VERSSTETEVVNHLIARSEEEYVYFTKFDSSLPPPADPPMERWAHMTYINEWQKQWISKISDLSK